MAFTPKFIDLVKNITRVQGAAPATLDQEVTGFASFVSACAAGDQFYYSIQGIDKPAETEVGRGTLLADGTIMRDPIDGAAFDFSKGRKSIALVTAAEWLTQVDAAIKVPPSAGGVPDRLFAQCSGAAVPTSRTRIDSAGHGAIGIGAARYCHDAAVDEAYVAANPLTAFVAADGRGFRLDPEQRLTIEMFGGRGDYVDAGNVGTDNYAAIMAAAQFAVTAASKYTLPVHFGLGKYYASQTPVPAAVFHFKGASVGLINGGAPGTAATWLVTPTNTTCIQLGGGAVNAAGSIIEGFHFHQVTQGNDLSAHGVDAIQTPILINCSASNIAGNAFNIAAWTDGGGRTGNCNNWRMTNCMAHSCGGHGLRVAGSDANGGVNIGFITHAGVTRCGIYDSAYFVNTHIGVQITGYGGGGVQYGGRAWQALASGNADIAPGTHTSYWVDRGPLTAPNAKFPAWAAGTDYPLQAPIIAGVATFVGPYIEGGGPTYGYAHSSGGMVYGANMGWTPNTPIVSNGTNASVTAPRGMGQQRGTGGDVNHPAYAAIGEGESTIIGARPSSGGDWDKRSLIFAHQVGGQSWTWGYENINGGVERDIMSRYDGKPLWMISGAGTVLNYGRSAPEQGIFTLFDFAIQDATNGNNRKIMGVRGAAPDSGSHAQGEFFWNANPYSGGAGNILGWSCTGSGEPGTWTPLHLFQKMPARADSAAVDVAGLRNDLNMLIADLRTAGMIAS
nr:hypothetical protein [uncultured Sphingomonas sp.]